MKQKHIMTFESFTENYDEMLEEGKIGDIISKAGDKITDAFVGWDKQEVVDFGKKFGLQYVQNGSIKKDDYQKAKEANFDPKNPDSKAFLMACAKIKASKTSRGGHSFGGGAN